MSFYTQILVSMIMMSSRRCPCVTTLVKSMCDGDTHIHDHHLNLADDQHSVLVRLSYIHVTVGNIDSLAPAAVHSFVSTDILLQHSSIKMC